MKFIVLNNHLPADKLSTLFELQADCFSDSWSHAQIERQLRDTKGLSIGCLHEEQLVGFLFYQLIFENAEILQIGIATKYRKQRVAQQLLVHSFDMLKQLPEIEKVLLEVSANNLQGINLYEKLCFDYDGLRKNYYPCAYAGGPKIDAQLYSLVLAND